MALILNDKNGTRDNDMDKNGHLHVHNGPRASGTQHLCQERLQYSTHKRLAIIIGISL